MKIMKFKRILLTAALTAALAVTSAVPAMAETVTADSGDQAVVTTTAATAATTTKWTSSKLKAAKVSLKSVASYSYDKIKLTWEPLSGVDGYQIYRATSKSGTYSKVTSVTGASKSSYINEGRTCGKTYYYKLRAYKRINGKTVYSKFSSVMSAYAKPAKVKITDAYAPDLAQTTIAVDFTTVRGATDYEAQINQIKPNGQETGFRSYSYDIDGFKRYFSTYKSNLALQKKYNPSGYVSVAVYKDGKLTSKKITVEEYAESMIAKNQVNISFVQDESTYQFRVRAYRTVNGKKIYGSWSDVYTLKERLNVDEIYQEVRQYAIDYAAANEPRWHYEDRPTGNPQNSNYYSDGEWAGFSIYSKQEEVIAYLKGNAKRYISQVVEQGGYDSGFIFFSRVGVGDWDDHFGKNEGPDVYYNAFMLY